jgi:hypothetical protein
MPAGQAAEALFFVWRSLNGCFFYKHYPDGLFVIEETEPARVE